DLGGQPEENAARVAARSLVLGFDRLRGIQLLLDNFLLEMASFVSARNYPYACVSSIGSCAALRFSSVPVGAAHWPRKVRRTSGDIIRVANGGANGRVSPGAGHRANFGDGYPREFGGDRNRRLRCGRRAAELTAERMAAQSGRE